MNYDLIQLTDCHLFKNSTKCLNNVNTYTTLKQVLSQMTTDSFERLIFTGDLAQDEQLATYQHYIDLTQHIKNPIHFIPGNHDCPEAMDKILNQNSWSTDKHFDLKSWRVILLNSHYPNHTAGYLSKYEQHRLTNLLASWSGPVLIFLHHHVIDPVVVDCKEDISLLNKEQLIKTIHPYQSQIKAIISGHLHAEYQTQYSGFNFITTPSTCFQFKCQDKKISIDTHKSPAYRWFKLNDNEFFETGVTYLVT